MSRLLVCCLCLFCLAAPAHALDFVEEYGMSDPLARRIVCTGTHEAPRMLGPYYSFVSMFSVPEPGGSGERLYVGFVDDLQDGRSRSFLWRGPVAAHWKNLRPVPERRREFPAPNPKRYRIDRLIALPGGGTQTSAMEINLEAKAASLLLLGGGPGGPQYLDSQHLEALPMNESLELAVRLEEQQVFQTDKLRLSSYAVRMGGCPPTDRPRPREVWHVALDPHLLAVCRKDDPSKAVLHFLPVRPYGWKTEKLLARPANGEVSGSFVLQMLAPYLTPHEQGQLMKRAARYRVSLSLRELDISTLERDLEYDLASESWVPGSGETKIKYVPKP